MRYRTILPLARFFVLTTCGIGSAFANDADNANNDNNDEGEYYHQFTVCEDSEVVVEEISMLCDTPGQYYYGKNLYRNSATCQGGDKAKYEIEVEIMNDMEDGYVPYITMDVQGYGTVESIRIYDSENLCELSDLWSLDGGECPQAGRYAVNSVFYWGAQNDQYSYNFRPHIEIGVSSQQGSNNYDLGGANTENCKGGTYNNWTTGVRKSVSSSAALKTFLITSSVLFVFVLAGLSGYSYAKRHFGFFASDDDSESGKDENFMNDEDVKRIAMMGRERDLIDA